MLKQNVFSNIRPNGLSQSLSYYQGSAHRPSSSRDLVKNVLWLLTMVHSVNMFQLGLLIDIQNLMDMIILSSFLITLFSF